MKKILVVAALLTGSHTFAQTDTTKVLDEIIVSAGKFPSKSLETGKVVILITREEIERSGSKSLTQIINEQGGICINGSSSNPGKDKSIYLRGANVEHTLITIDGVPVYDATGIGSNFDIRNIPVETVERIEILKGSHGSLYGSDAVAGVINIITKKPEQKKLSADGSLSFGSYNSFKSSIGLSGKIKKTDYKAGYEYYKTDGFSEAIGPLSPKPEKDGYLQHAVYGGIGILVNSNFRFQPFFRYSTINGATDQDAFQDDKDFTYGIKNTQAGVQSELKWGKGKLKQVYQYTQTNREFNNDSTDYSVLYEKNSFAHYHSHEHFAEVYFVQPFEKFTATIGSDYRASSTEQVSYYNYGFGGSPDTLPQPAKQNQASIYGAINYIHKRFSIEAGGRYNQHSKYGGNAAFNLNPSFVTGKQLKIFSNISSGYRTPGLYQLYSVYGNKDLKPEQSLNIEGGMQTFSRNNKASLRATIFYRDVKNLIVFFTGPTFISNYMNRDRQKDHGVEIDGKMDAGSIHVKVFYSYVDGKVLTKNGTKDTSFFNLYRRPNHSAALHVGWQATRKLYTSLQMNYNGKSSDLYFNMSSFKAEEVTLTGYLLVNLYAEYKLSSKGVTVFAEGRNILNNKYQEVYGYNTAMFNASAGFRFKF
jgi:vitamin B12 transporter